MIALPNPWIPESGGGLEPATERTAVAAEPHTIAAAGQFVRGFDPEKFLDEIMDNAPQSFRSATLGVGRECQDR